MDFDEKLMTLVVHGANDTGEHDSLVWSQRLRADPGVQRQQKGYQTHVEQEWQETLARILEGEGVKCPPYLSDLTSNDLSAKWITESGLYELCCSSKLPLARTFKKWVFGEVLPSIRKTGSYSVQSAAPAAKQSDAWQNKRLEGKELMRLKNASLQELIAGGFGQTGSMPYRVAANHINQAVLGFTETTTCFKKHQQLPRHMSIPDILNMQGQVARCFAETCFQRFVSDYLQPLRGLPEADLIKEFAGLKLNLRQGFVSTGMGDLRSQMLPIADAKKRKLEIATQARKQQRLLQAEYPLAIKCTA